MKLGSQEKKKNGKWNKVRFKIFSKKKLIF